MAHKFAGAPCTRPSSALHPATGQNGVARPRPGCILGLTLGEHRTRSASASSLRLGGLSWLAVLAPGLMTAATGVGAGDLATGSLAGSKVGVAVLWAVWAGALLKWVLTEGIARWQLATRETVLAGATERFGRVVAYLFLTYLLLWSFFVGAALISACGVAAHALVPLFSPERDKQIWGFAHSLAGLLLVWFGGFRLIEKVMRFAVAVMFVTVVTAAVLVTVQAPDLSARLGEIARGVLVPTIPAGRPDTLGWTVALMGGVGGTVTVLSYGYWIREQGREGKAALAGCRLDLAVGYTFTALFGMAMVVIGSTVAVQGSGASLVVQLADRLEEPLGPAGRWLFVAGAWAAIASSLLGVWQSVPYLFADLWSMLRNREPRRDIDVKAAPYRAYLVAIALLPTAGLFVAFARVQKVYAVAGALFMPMLALALLALNGRTAWVGADMKNRPWAVVLLVATLLVFCWFGWRTIDRVW